MYGRERREQVSPARAAELRAGLTSPQRATLATMEQFGWRLQFVRRPLFREPVPVLLDRSGTRFAVLEEDGTFHEDPDFRIRG